MYDNAILEFANKIQLQHTPGFNSGVIGLPKGILDDEITKDLLNYWDNNPTINWFTEQTIHNILFTFENASHLPKDKYVISKKRMFYFENDIDYENIHLRHFVNPVRHLMKIKGIPEFLEKINYQIS